MITFRMDGGVRPGFRAVAIACVVILLPIAVHTLWDYVEVRRLASEIDALRRRGEPVSREQLGRWNRPAREEEQRAARYYEAAAALGYRDWTPSPISGLPAAKSVREARIVLTALARSGSSALTSEALAQLRALVAEYRDAIELVDRAAPLAFTSFPPHGEDYAREYSLEDLALVSAGRTVLLAVSGDGAAAAQSLLSSLRLRRAFTRSVSWISEPIVDLQVLLERGNPPSELLDSLQQAFGDRESPAAVERSLREQRAWQIEDVWFELYGKGSSPLVAANNVRWTWRPSMLLRPWVTHRMVENLHLQQDVLDAASRKWPDKLPALAAVAARHPDRGHPWMEWPKLFNDDVAPMYASSIAPAAGVSLAHLRSARTALAVERFRRDHGGALPGTLADLHPQYLDALPEDPFNGTQLRYRHDATGFAIYSVGVDRKDDGGQLSPGVRYVGGRATSKDVGLRIRESLIPNP